MRLRRLQAKELSLRFSMTREAYSVSSLTWKRPKSMDLVLQLPKWRWMTLQLVKSQRMTQIFSSSTWSSCAMYTGTGKYTSYFLSLWFFVQLIMRVEAQKSLLASLAVMWSSISTNFGLWIILSILRHGRNFARNTQAKIYEVSELPLHRNWEDLECSIF